MTKEEMVEELGIFIQHHDVWQLNRVVVKDFIWKLMCDGRESRKCAYANCQRTFIVKRKDQKFCTRACKKAHHNSLRKKTRNP